MSDLLDQIYALEVEVYRMAAFEGDDALLLGNLFDKLAQLAREREGDLKTQLADVEQMNHSLQRRIMDLEGGTS